MNKDDDFNKLFKQIFDSDENITKSFLNTFLRLNEENSIENIEFLKNYDLKEKNYFYIQCIDKKKNEFYVEINIKNENDFSKHFPFESSNSFYNYFNKKQNNKESIPMIYSINILNTNYFKCNSKNYHCLRIYEIENSNLTSQKIEYIIIELPKFDPNVYNKKEEEMLKYWQIFLISSIGLEKNISFPDKMYEIPIFKKAIDIFKRNEMKKKEYNPYWRYYSSFINYGNEDHYNDYVLLRKIINISGQYDNKIDNIQKCIKEDYMTIIKCKNMDLQQKKIKIINFPNNNIYDDDDDDNDDNDNDLHNETFIKKYFNYIYKYNLNDYLDDINEIIQNNKNTKKQLKITQEIYDQLKEEVNQLRTEEKDLDILEKIKNFNEYEKTLKNYIDDLNRIDKEIQHSIKTFYLNNEKKIKN
eukprot:jgi/Orpsp1_1/1178681/evm.model.c7180000066321.1